VFRILVAVDGSATSDDAMRFAADLGRRIGNAVLVLVNVQRPAMAGEVSNLMTAEDVMQEHTDAGHSVLARARAAAEAAGLACESEIVIGRAAEEIVRYAEARDCDMIVIGGSGHGRIGSLILGSVASKVVHGSNVPVTVVK